MEWTTKRIHVLSLNGIPAIEVEENKLGLPVMAAFHVKVPPRHDGVFQVNIHGDMKGTHIISAKSQFLEKNPNVFQHEISIVTDEANQQGFPLIAVTNLDFAKTLHIGKGEIIGFARPESEKVMYIAMTDEISMDPYVDNAPRNWIPPRKRKTLNQIDNQHETFDSSKESSQHSNCDTVMRGDGDRLLDKSMELRIQQQWMPNMMKVKAKELQGVDKADRLYDELTNQQIDGHNRK